MSVAGVCRECGCTDERPCILEPDPRDIVDGVDLLLEARPTTCSWVEVDLCSACHTPDDGEELDDQAEDDAGAVIFDAHGNPWRSGGRS